MNRYQHSDTKEFKTYTQLKADIGGAGSFPQNGRPVIATNWVLVSPGSKPTPGNEITHGVREIDPVDHVQTFEVYELPDEEQTANQEAADTLAAGEIDNDFNTALSPITSIYPEYETKLWDKLETEARAWDANDATPTTAIDLVIARSGEDKATYVASIIAKADLYIVTAFTALGDKRKAIIDLG